MTSDFYYFSSSFKSKKEIESFIGNRMFSLGMKPKEVWFSMDKDVSKSGGEFGFLMVSRFIVVGAMASGDKASRSRYSH